MAKTFSPAHPIMRVCKISLKSRGLSKIFHSALFSAFPKSRTFWANSCGLDFASAIRIRFVRHCSIFKPRTRFATLGQNPAWVNESIISLSFLPEVDKARKIFRSLNFGTIERYLSGWEVAILYLVASSHREDTVISGFFSFQSSFFISTNFSSVEMYLSGKRLARIARILSGGELSQSKIMIHFLFLFSASLFSSISRRVKANGNTVSSIVQSWFIITMI